MQSLLILLAHLIGLCALVLYLHYRHPRLGYAPMLMVLGGLVAITQGTGAIVFSPFEGVRLIVNSNVLVPIVIVSVLVIYVSSGSAPARWFIAGVAVVSAVVLLTLLLYVVYLQQPDTFSFNIDLERLLSNSLGLRTVTASVVTFMVDMLIIIVVYQGVRNAFGWLPEIAVVACALLAALGADVIVFNFLAWFGTPNYSRLLPGDMFGKMLSGVVLAPIVGFYLTRFAPRLPYFVGGRGRRVFDIAAPDVKRLKRELRQTQRALSQEHAQLQEQRARVEMMREFIGEVSHDLKNPLTSINLRLGLIAHIDDEARRAKMLDEIKDLSTRMSTMIDDLMVLARLENDLSGDFQPLALDAVIAGSLARLAAQIEAKQLAVSVEWFGPRPTLQADVLDLTRAFDNLIGNAVHYTGPQGTVKIEVRAEAEHTRIDIIDTGIGIPAHELERIFERFYRASNARRAVEGGTGLGLPIVQRVIAQHGGTIAVTSEIGQGTRFTLTLPCRQALRME
jgi:signal transduction histidine kinase